MTADRRTPPTPSIDARRRARTILWLDGGPGLLVGILLWLLRPWLAPLYALPDGLYTLVASANVAYGCFGTALAIAVTRGGRPPVGAITALAGANALWAVVCAVLLALAAFAPAGREFGLLGLLHLAGEGLFVASLAVAEWRFVRPWASQVDTPQPGSLIDRHR